jgi:hypothetical protein
MTAHSSDGSSHRPNFFPVAAAVQSTSPTAARSHRELDRAMAARQKSSAPAWSVSTPPVDPRSYVAPTARVTHRLAA